MPEGGENKLGSVQLCTIPCRCHHPHGHGQTFQATGYKSPPSPTSTLTSPASQPRASGVAGYNSLYLKCLNRGERYRCARQALLPDCHGGDLGGVRPHGGLQVLRRRRAPQAHRDDVDGERAHHHGRDRVRGAVAGVGDRAARLGGRPRRHAALLLRHLLHVGAARRLLPLRRPVHRQAQLHIHGRGQRQSQWHQGPALRLPAVRQHRRSRHRLHHCRLHQHAGDQEGQLLPRGRPRGPVQHLQHAVHDRLRRRRDLLLADPGLRPDLVAVHPGRRHVLHLLDHRPGPGHRPGRRQQRDPRQPHWHQRGRGHPAGQGVAQPAGVRRHRLRLLLLAHPDRDPGHHPRAAAVRVQGHAPRHGRQRRGHHALLHALRVRGLCRVRRQRPRQPPHGLRLLRALLAPGRGQRRHRRAPRGRLPGVLPAAVRVRGEVGAAAVAQVEVRHGRGRRAAVPGRGRWQVLQAEPVQADVADGVRGGHDGGVHAAALLQRRGGAAGGAGVLAPHRVLSCGDVHRAEEGAPVEHAVGVPAAAQPRLPHHHRRLRRGLRRGDHR